MNKLVLLPGNGAHNREWIESVQARLGGQIQIYRHWQSGEALIQFDHEADVLARVADGESICVFAKSAGCFVAMKAVREQGVKIERAVFVGVAVEWGEELKIPVREWLADWDVPTLFVHKIQDPVIHLDHLKPLLPAGSELLDLPGADHDYLELDTFIPKARSFLLPSDGCSVE
ncbi:hypothetical protein HZA87_02970 [Candidatus Uhrbacteria bacterium]|nr:hypothetical protein [Candidatus Uhrbacteria bacterium]